MKSRLFCASMLLLAGTVTTAADRGKAATTIGGKAVTIEYGRPLLKGRTLAQLLEKLPQDRIWRAGDDQVTILETATPLVLGSETVPAGRYSLYVHLPATGPRSLVVNKDLGQPLRNLWKEAPPEKAELPWPHLEGYETSIRGTEVARIAMKKEDTKAPVDPFTIGWEPNKTGARLRLAWGEEAWTLDVRPGK